ncbi:type II secretion system inner membrane protein GspF [Salinispirillum sp. LH 10-3-1]|uniref:Type II secretion system inner membrane protein GspF n=1 Tax=Salinispirillum sp. LH 10-3-1 TaxID=2952525 RepID=A0AB38YBW3_9GAMM
MAAFEYTALDERGRQKKGVLEGDSPRQVRTQLRDKGWVPLEVERAAEQKKSNGWLRQPTISVSELAMVTRQLSTLVASSMPLEECLRAVAEQNESRRLRSMFMAIRAKVLEGYSLAKAFGEYPRAFDNQYCATIDAGEHSGKLDLVLSRLADYVEDQEETRRKLQMAATYPVILTVIAVGIVVFLLNNVVPRILDVFTSSGQILPPATLALIAVTDFFQSYWIHVVVGMVLSGVTFHHWNRDIKRRRLTHLLYLRIPFIRSLIRGFSTSRFASTVAMLASSGVPLVEAMRIAGSVINNLPIRYAVADATRKVSEGGTMSRALKETGYFPPMMIHMIASGESSGNLEDMLARTARTQEQALKDVISTVVGLLEPLMLILMGLIVMIILLAVVLPLTQMNTMV